MLQQQPPITNLQQQGTQLLLKVCQWLFDKNQCFRGLAWEHIRLPPNRGIGLATAKLGRIVLGAQLN